MTEQDLATVDRSVLEFDRQSGAMVVFVGMIVGFVALTLVSAMYGVLGGLKEQA